MPNVKFAAIDIGSNAVRLLVSNVYEAAEGTRVKKLQLVRAPIRLGQDAFLEGKISEEKQEKFIHAMKAFHHLMELHDVHSYLACATSAMRDASNSDALIKRVKKETGIKIQTISGQREAEVIYSTQIQDYIKINRAYLYVDVGGGSTEITLFLGKKSVASRSFNIGTLRLLNGKVSDKQWKELRKWVKDTVGIRDMDVDLIGSGGNINKTFKMLRKEQSKPIRSKELQNFHEFLSSYTAKERVQYLDLRPDRADVIVHALDIFMAIMKSADSKRLYVPKFGLSDGIIKVLYDGYLEEVGEK